MGGGSGGCHRTLLFLNCESAVIHTAAEEASSPFTISGCTIMVFHMVPGYSVDHSITVCSFAVCSFTVLPRASKSVLTAFLPIS